MYLVKPTRKYCKSYNKLEKSGVKNTVLESLDEVIDTIAKMGILDAKYSDHKLHGDCEGYRECHVRSDLLLVYRIQEKQLVLVLIDIGTHSYLFGYGSKSRMMAKMASLLGLL